MKNVLVLGGGIAGIAAAYEISKRLPDSSVTLIEKSNDMGGMLQAIKVGPHQEYMDIFYHHIFDRDTNFLEMVKIIDKEDRIVWTDATTAFYSDGNFYKLTSPQDILFFPLLSIIQR